MALEDLNVKPGLFTILTDRLAMGRWKYGDHVRFHNGLPEKLGGWIKSGSNTFLGICRGITDWITLSAITYIGLGTHLKWYVWTDGTFYDITPIRKTTSPLGNDPFSTVSTTAVITVHDTGHGAQVGDFVTISGATAVATVTVNGQWQVASVIDGDNWTFVAASNANATTTGGGNAAVAAYQINTGNADTSAGLGWGIGPWGGGTYGTARTVGGGTVIDARTWTQDQWGEDLIGCPRDGGIYLWDASVGTGTRAAVISQAPAVAKGIFVFPDNKSLVAYGAHDGSIQDPMLVRWSNSNDYTTWNVDPLNDAGVKRITTGTQLITHVKAAGEVCLFTDSNLWSMSFIGPPYTYGWKDRGANGRIMGSNAAIQVDGKVYWMGQSEFYAYDGTIQILQCDVYNQVFRNVNIYQRAKVSCGFNRRFRELWWHYPSAASNENDSYVFYNVYEQTWSLGTMVRTMFVGDSKVISDVYATGTDGYIYYHENGLDADNVALPSYLESWDVEVPYSSQQNAGPGDYVMSMNRAIPDFKDIVGSITMTLVGKKYPQDTDVITKGPYTITATTTKINPRMRCRQVSIQIESANMGVFWRYGGIRPDVRQHGKR